jgi:biotin carboxyl carrier protein
MRRFVLTIEGTDYEIEVSKDTLVVNGHPFNVKVGNDKVTVDGIEYGVEINQGIAWVDGFAYPFVSRDGRGPSSPPEREVVQRAAPKPSSQTVVRSGHSVVAIMPGKVLRVLVKEGDAVQEGDVVCILEAMKMENELHAHHTSTVQQVLVQPGQSVEAGEPLVILA